MVALTMVYAARRARSAARARRLEVPKARIVAALVSTAGAARKEKTAKALSVIEVASWMEGWQWANKKSPAAGRGR